MRFGRLYLLLVCMVCWSVAQAWAATPFVADAWRYGTRQSYAALRYCIDMRDPDQTVARKIAASVASALLLRADEYLIGKDPATEDVSGEDLDGTYRMLIQHCDVFFGFKLVPDAYPDWVTISRPYYRSRYLFVAADTAWKSLGDVPVSRPIGATIGSAADLRLSQYLLSIQSGPHWDKYPMASDEAALKAVVRGTTGAALVWAPALWALRRTNPAIAALQEISSNPLPVSTADVGAILLRQQSFLRTSVDQAIASLTSDGTIAAILKNEAFPATTVP